MQRDTYSVMSAVVWNTLGYVTVSVAVAVAGSDAVGGLIFRPFKSPASAQGQKFRATIVKAVSNELERVLVEQNHCQGLNKVIKSYIEY